MKPKDANINRLSYLSVPISLYFNETMRKLGDATGFIYEKNNKFFLVTNWHNVTGLNPITKRPLGDHGGIPDRIVMTLQIQKQPYIGWKNFQLDLYNADGEAEWLVHPKHREEIDVIAIEVKVGEGFEGILRPINKVKFDDFSLEVSDDIFILGYPYLTKGSGYFPIWKRGSVATEPDIDLEGLPKFFVDTASRPGMSGSPVFFKRTGIHGVVNGAAGPDTVIGEIEGFVGIYSGRVLGKTELEAQLGIVWKKHVIDEIIAGQTRDKMTFP